MKKLLLAVLMVSSPILLLGSNLKKAEKLYNKGCSLLNSGKYVEALKQFEAALKIESSNPLLWCARANAYFYMQSYHLAIRDYTAAINLAPQIGSYYYARAQAYEAIGNYVGAMNDVVIAAQYGEPAAQQIIAAINAKNNAQQEKARKEMNEQLEQRFGFKKGTLK